ncbi:MAG: hypothetical protein P0Y59_15245 [Candidatus Sphingomonas phytovorans]|nr:nucleotide synthetase [Sphingomonas sp.]WEJ98299.1 MAG: hypothetical protein P0Y59_15245 [Sphingomonas sp.]
MATKPLCNMSTFRPGRYFEQHELSPVGPISYDYEVTRSFLIRAETSTRAGPLDDLTISIYPFEESVPDVGTPHMGAKTWRDVLQHVLNSQPFIGVTSLDFSLAVRSRVILLLAGKFWRFSNTMAPMTTKFDLGTQYFDLLRHKLDEKGNAVEAGPTDDCQCISFFADQPCPSGLNVAHGFSLNIELVNGGKVLLPMTIDPDIENKGGD